MALSENTHIGAAGKRANKNKKILHRIFCLKKKFRKRNHVNIFSPKGRRNLLTYLASDHWRNHLAYKILITILKIIKFIHVWKSNEIIVFPMATHRKLINIFRTQPALITSLIYQSVITSLIYQSVITKNKLTVHIVIRLYGLKKLY